jgi:hypothetical protein
MVFAGPTARIPAESPKHADAPSGTRGSRAKANRVRLRRVSFSVCAAMIRRQDASGSENRSRLASALRDEASSVCVRRELGRVNCNVIAILRKLRAQGGDDRSEGCLYQGAVRAEFPSKAVARWPGGTVPPSRLEGRPPTPGDVRPPSGCHCFRRGHAKAHPQGMSAIEGTARLAARLLVPREKKVR